MNDWTERFHERDRAVLGKLARQARDDGRFQDAYEIEREAAR